MIFDNLDDFIKTVRIKPDYKLASLDIGGKKIGTALWSSFLNLVTPGKVIYRSHLDKDLDLLKAFIKENSINGLVLGLPLQMDAKEGTQCQSIRKFATAIEEAFNIPMIFQDERLTTAFANKLTKDMGHSRKKGNQVDDSIAALLILESFIKKLN